MLACLLLLVGVVRVIADCHQYAYLMSPQPAVSCSAANNEVGMGDFVDCNFQESTVDLWCLQTASDIACVQGWNQYLNQPFTYSGIINQEAGWCVNGTCNYASFIFVQTDTVTNYPVYVSVSPCPQ